MIDPKRKCNDLTGKEWLKDSFSIWRNISKTPEEKMLNHPASYPVALCEKLIQCFSKINSNVLDPFNGIGSTTLAAHNLGRIATGIDLNKEYCNIAQNRVIDDKNISIINGNSITELNKLHENTFDLCLTSPPYWDILNMKRSADKKINSNYSCNDADLGNINDYWQFVETLIEIFKQVYFLLKQKSYCLLNVMDIRKQSNFYPLHMDLSTELTKINFVLDDIIIWDRQSDYNNMRPLGYPYKFRINKVHEYILIFYKQ